MSRTVALSRDRVRRIRLAYDFKGRTMKSLAEQHGVAVSTIYKAVHRLPPYHPKYQRKEPT